MVITPKSALKRDTNYTVSWENEEGRRFSLTDFRTGNETVQGRPSAPVLGPVERVSVADMITGKLHPGAAASVSAPGAVLLEVYVDGVLDSVVYAWRSPLVLSSGITCGISSVDTSSAFHLTVRSIDAAGNASAVVERTVPPP